MSAHYGQLSYTSLDGAGRGGWQVKETAGDLTTGESDLLVSKIQLALNPVEQLPAYPTPAQLRAAPRRMAYRRLDDDTAVYFHTAPAGLDGTGRPGNIFAHALLERDASQPAGAPRPITLWRSRRWLTPYGDREVAAAVLPDKVPGPGDVVTASSVIQFVCDIDIWRIGTLCGLLDAATAALGGGPAVVLGVESADDAAQWIGAVSFLMSPGTARRLNFCISDRTFGLEYLLGVGHHLVTVPRHDLGDVPPGVLVIDDAETLFLGEFNQTAHRTARGQRIVATAWSAMAQVVLVDPSSAAQALADIDYFSACLVDVDLPPSLPMAIAVLNRIRWEDAAREARSVIAGPVSRAEVAAHGVSRIVDHEVRRLVNTTQVPPSTG